jgi:MFS family permease
MGAVSKGNLLMFFNNTKRIKKYVLAILIGLPTWYVIGVLVAFSNDFAKEFGITEKINPGEATMFAYVGISVGDVLIGFVSHWLKSRKKALFIFYILTLIAILFYFNQGAGSATRFYIICVALGFGTGFWAIFVTMAAEQFGTNLRATAATTIPNMVRGALPLILILFNWLQEFTGHANAGLITGFIIMAISFLAMMFTEETFGKDLDYIEQ